MTTLAKIGSQVPAAYEMLRWVGLQRRRSRMARIARRAGLVGAGLAVGGGLALLLAPRAGAETRRKLRGHAEQLRDYVAPEESDGASSQPSPMDNAQRARSRQAGPIHE